MNVILSIAGHDPSGGAGIQADIETALALGCHASSLITCLTVQDTQKVYQIQPVDPFFFKKQADIILSDLTVSMIKIGLIGNLAIAQQILQILQQYPSIPVVFDPVLASGAGDSLANKKLIFFINQYIIPCCCLLTPNVSEAQKLTQLHHLEAMADSFLTQGVKAVLITGTDNTALNKKNIEHYLFQKNKTKIVYKKMLLKGQYHGSGCTLAMALACFLTQSESLELVISKALDFTEYTLLNAMDIGHGQSLPLRLKTL